MSSDKAWVTLATNDSYSLGALVLAHSLKTVKTAYKLAILITPGVTAPMKQQIEAVFDDVKTVDVLDSKDQAHLALMRRPELGVTFTKLHCWTFTGYEKCVFLDADTLVLQNCDELFEREELSAAPDPGWPDCFNSGVFVYRPSQDTFNELLEFARTRGSFDGGDQGLLNMFFKDWALKDISKHLSFTYNVVWSSTYSYLPALKQFGQDMKIVHFIASSKPWLQSFDADTRLVTATSGGAGLQTLLQLWWDLFRRHVRPGLSTEMIENRLSSRYSEVPCNNNNPNIRTPCNSSSNDRYTAACGPPNEDNYSFVDPWDEYLVVGDRKKRELEATPIRDCRFDNAGCGGDVVVDVCSGGPCEKDAENDYRVNDRGENRANRSFQTVPLDNTDTSGSGQRNTGRPEEPSDSGPVGRKRERGNGNRPAACTDNAVPINPKSGPSVNNSRPDHSATRCEVVPAADPRTHVPDGGLAGQFARIPLDENTVDRKAVEDFVRRQSWEQGNVDYLGRDSFSNIWAKINDTLGNVADEAAAAAVRPDADEAVKTVSPPEVVFAEDPKPLKSALKKTSTTASPVQSELVEVPLPVKQLEKLDLSNDDSKRPGTPETPTVTAPTPPATSQAEPPGPEAAGPGRETTARDEQADEPVGIEEPPPPPPEAVERDDESLPAKPDGPVKEASGQPEPSASNDPPVAPKRANKGSSASAHKNGKPSENK